MNRLTVETDNAANAKRLADFLKSIGYVKSVNFEKKLKPLTGADWIKPGRPATDEELEQLAKEMDEDTGEYTPEEVYESVKKEIAVWRKRNK
ncbi:MAG: hypothetical protein ABII90_08770 [Bacteroidota bacterium]